MLDKLPPVAALAALLPTCVVAQDATEDVAPISTVVAERPVVMDSFADKAAAPEASADDDGSESAMQEADARHPSAGQKPETIQDPATVLEPAIVAPEGFVPFKCPIERIRDAYQNLVDPEDTLVALAIEKQTLAICRQSQEALILIAENERRLVELFEPIIAPPPPPPPAPGTVSANAPPTLPGETQAETGPAQPSEPEFVPPSYILAATMKDPMGWKAIVADGGATFAVRAGDVMDDGSVVVSIERGRMELLAPDETGFSLE